MTDWKNVQLNVSFFTQTPHLINEMINDLSYPLLSNSVEAAAAALGGEATADLYEERKVHLLHRKMLYQLYKISSHSVKSRAWDRVLFMTAIRVMMNCYTDWQSFQYILNLLVVNKNVS